ncbi:MAG TPA: type VI secretion system membrane subunit TssM [Polyangiaceae bacterium]|nr:type VI secretion system membrane subunit TssM [Polyangiaceae bacterium]
MWLWILAIVLLLLMWGVWYILQPPEGMPAEPLFPLWLAVTITAVVLAVLIGIFVYRRIRAARAARALEKAIAQQAQEQVAQAKPEERAEVIALQRQMLEGIKALKASRLGQGDALYALPWYAIVGPPGAGKTTALRHSGLSFPYLDPNGQGVRGVGGTRNCDWWFTNEAILLDTAGRYTTEQEDHDEWMAFLDMLRTHRKHKPLNGIVVAVAVSDLIDASEEEIEQMAERVRSRIDEMQIHLKMVMPVYVLFTKCDLIAGFVEYFGDLKRSERGQPWGATVPLSLDKSSPSALFDGEFDLLVDQLHKRTLRRINSGRAGRREKEKIYQFPLEFAAVKRNLSDFIGAAFRPATPPANKKMMHAATPIMRGFYFTSGTQEGKPLDRVVGAMGRAFGLRPVETVEPEVTEPKSYFLKDVFSGIIFPDQDLAGRTEDEVRRVRMQRILIAAGAFLIACLLVIPAIFSYLNNRDLVAETKRISDGASGIDWRDDRDTLAKVDQLDALRAHLEMLDRWNEEGAPLAYRWGMYQGDTLFEPALEQYIAELKKGFVWPVKEGLEKRMPGTGANYLDEYNTLKTYLLLNDPQHIQDYDQWETGRLTQEWASVVRGGAPNVSERDLRDKLFPHVNYYVQLLKRGIIKGEDLDQGLIASTRDVLTRVGPSQRYYAQYVDALIDEKIDEAGPNTPDNMKYPPISLNDLFQDRPDALTKLSSKRKKREAKLQLVRGPYTAPGHEEVLRRLEEGYSRIERELWVVPLTTEEKQQPEKIKQALERVRQDYDNQYINEWTEFFRDVDVAVPQNNVESIDEFKVLSTPDWPYWRLLKALRDNTQFDLLKEKEEPIGADGGVLDQIKSRVQRRVDSKLRTRGAGKALLGGGAGQQERVDPVPEKFESMVNFAFPASPKEGEPPPPSGLSGYVKNLEQLAGEMTIVEEGASGADPTKATELFEKAVSDSEAKILSLDRFGQELMRDLLMNPLRQSYKAMVRSAGGAASGLWEVEVYPPYNEGIKNRYPFNASSKRDASFEDAVAFYKPKDGILWGFYETYLKPFHRQVGNKYIPATALQGSPRPAKPFTPFNPNLYNCLERSSEITDALFAGEEPQVRFRVNLKTVSPIVSDIEFELDGQKKLYRNEKEFWHEFKWPGQEAPLTGAGITIRGAGGLNEEIRREGPWGLWRLLDSGRHAAAKEDDKMFVVEWQFSAPPVIVRMQMKPTKSNHPFPRDFFRNTNCPPSIGDTFGQPGG